MNTELQQDDMTTNEGTREPTGQLRYLGETAVFEMNPDTGLYEVEVLGWPARTGFTAETYHEVFRTFRRRVEATRLRMAA